MRGNKFEKSHIHILESETLNRWFRFTESYNRLTIQPLKITNSRPILTFIKTIILYVEILYVEKKEEGLRGKW